MFRDLAAVLSYTHSLEMQGAYTYMYIDTHMHICNYIAILYNILMSIYIYLNRKVCTSWSPGC